MAAEGPAPGLNVGEREAALVMGRESQTDLSGGRGMAGTERKGGGRWMGSLEETSGAESRRGDLEM